jgi:GNAT superfamily N-acetyltransferase
MHKVSVLVAERGADWLAWARVLRARATSTIVLAQPAAEDDAAFARRVTDRISRLEHEGAAVEQAAFIGGDRSDPLAKQQRSLILRRLASLLTGPGRTARLYVDSASRGGGASQRLMRALAWAIADWAKGSGLKVLLGARRPEPVSGHAELALTPLS